jgi:hypothetical protein
MAESQGYSLVIGTVYTNLQLLLYLLNCTAKGVTDKTTFILSFIFAYIVTVTSVSLHMDLTCSTALSCQPEGLPFRTTCG